MTKERLQRYRAIKRERDQLQQKLDEIEAALMSPRIQAINDMPAAPSRGNPQEALAVKHLELQELYAAKLAELAAEQLAVEEAINALGPTERTLLRHRYITGLTWEEICVRMSYCWRQVHRIHKRALKQLSEEAKE